MSASTLRQALGQLPVFITLIDRRGRVRWSSRYGYGYNPRNVIGLAVEDTVLPEDVSLWRAAWHRAYHGREAVRYSLRAVGPDLPGWCRISGFLSPVIFGGRVRYVAAVVTDATHAPNPLLAEQGFASFYSPREKQILGVLTASWQTSKEIAARLGERKATESLRVLLTNLTDRGAAESLPGRGYRLAPPPRRDDGDAGPG